jgi:SAM-dependent methyltransferase
VLEEWHLPFANGLFAPLVGVDQGDIGTRSCEEDSKRQADVAAPAYDRDIVATHAWIVARLAARPRLQGRSPSHRYDLRVSGTPLTNSTDDDGSSELKFTLEQNRKYWEDPTSVSLVDENMRELEVAFVSEYLTPHQRLADVGCGDGRATRRYARLVKSAVGIERSEHLRSIALADQQADPIPNLEFRAGDILDLPANEQFDVVVTERVLINLPSWRHQRQAIEQIARLLRPGGMYVMIENTEDGDAALNALRERVGLKAIPQHWHNLFLDWDNFAAFVQSHFETVERRGFSLYYVLTRVYAQMFASFTGFGAKAKADPVFEQLDPAARRLDEVIGSETRFGNWSVVGPIQGIALRKR